MKYIEDDELQFGDLLEEMISKFNDLILYIYHQFSLDYESMKTLYEERYCSIDYDYETSSSVVSKYLKFDNHEEPDNKYKYIFVDQLKEYHYKNERFINEIHKYLLKKPLKQLRFSNIKKILLNNFYGKNNSVKGVRDIDWKLHFWEWFEISDANNIRLHDFVVALYKIKSHKFDHYYEFYSKIQQFNISEISSDDLFIGIEFGKLIT